MTNPERHRRRSIRLHGQDYAQAGAYFVTVCTERRVCLLGTIVGGEVELSAVGCIVLETWEALPARFPQVELDTFVVMPNHVHGIVVITDKTGAQQSSAPTVGVADVGTRPTLGQIMRAFQSISAKRCNDALGRVGRFWQRNYYEHIIRDEADLVRLREYIVCNPGRWAEDDENPANARPSS